MLTITYIHPVRARQETVNAMPESRIENGKFRFNRFFLATIIAMSEDTSYNPDSDTVMYISNATRLNSGV